MNRKFSDDLWSMAVNVAAGTGAKPLPLFHNEPGWFDLVTKRVTEMGRRFAEQIRAYQRFRETFDELSSLDDRQLADIGVNRSEIHRVVALSALDEITARN